MRGGREKVLVKKQPSLSLSLSLSLFFSSLLLLLPFLLSGGVVVASSIPRFFRDVEDKTLTNLLLLLLFA
jgi:hypothetical protein